MMIYIKVVNKFMEIETVESIDRIAAGGRGHKAPYKTTHQRVPEPVKPVLEKIIKAYRIAYAEGSEEKADNVLVDIEEAIDKAVNKITPEENKAVNNYEGIRDRILGKVRSDKLKAVTKALNEFIANLEKA